MPARIDDLIQRSQARIAGVPERASLSEADQLLYELEYDVIDRLFAELIWHREVVQPFNKTDAKYYPNTVFQAVDAHRTITDAQGRSRQVFVQPAMHVLHNEVDAWALFVVAAAPDADTTGHLYGWNSHQLGYFSATPGLITNLATLDSLGDFLACLQDTVIAAEQNA